MRVLMLLHPTDFYNPSAGAVEKYANHFKDAVDRSKLGVCHGMMCMYVGCLCVSQYGGCARIHGGIECHCVVFQVAFGGDAAKDLAHTLCRDGTTISSLNQASLFAMEGQIASVVEETEEWCCVT